MDYILIQDDDSHWYVIPADKEDAWYEWFGTDDYESGIIPEYAEEVGGSPSLVRFKDYRID